ncbi:MAG: hypothetical protein ACREPD_05965 [Stenotrophomonas sp.]|uniref:hypothetical protein n=1 Tax=Stenotrophomonas sp. TaxID=69392 RepID=UPI003D6D78C5
MAVRAQCPRCRRFFDLTYWELCSRMSRHLTAPWRGTCPFCSRPLRLRFWIECVAFLFALASLMAALWVCVPIAKLGSVWFAVPFGWAASYFAPGAWRYYAADTWKII